MPMHPLPILLNNGVPVALCSDDPAVFGNLGLTYNFFQVCLIFGYSFDGNISPTFQVLVSSEVSGLSTLGQLARDSLEVTMSV